MPDVLSAALSGLNSSRLRQLTSANNIANSLTPGYRAARVQTSTGPGGQGAQVTATVRDLSPGAIQVTDQPLDLAIMGNGLFELTDGAGNTTYTRNGAFQLDADGTIVDGNGLAVSPGIQVPQGAENIQVDFEGTVSAEVGGARADLGQIQLANFSNPNGLSAQGDSAFLPTGASGIPQLGQPGTGDRGTIRSGMLEGSNVDLAEEIINQLTEEKMFAANAISVRAYDEMTREVLDILA